MYNLKSYKKRRKSLLDKTWFLRKEKTATINEVIATVLYPHGSGYPLESCSSAELSSVSPDETKFHQNHLMYNLSFQHKQKKFRFFVNHIYDRSYGQPETRDPKPETSCS
jgi:hypothetical protein